MRQGKSVSAEWTPSAHMQGSVVLRTKHKKLVKHLDDGTPVEREFSAPTVCHDDIIGTAFWKQHPELLA